MAQAPNAPGTPAPSAEADNKQAVIEGIKKVIAKLGSQGVLQGEVAYRQLVHEPKLLSLFLQACRKAPALLSGIALDEVGQDVTDPNAPLNCGTTLNEIEQRLIRTCARYHFESQDGEVKPAAKAKTVVTRNFFGFKKTETVSAAAEPGKGPGAVKARAIVPVMKEAWQLDMLDAYAALPPGIVGELGETLLVVRNPALFAEVAKLDPITARKGRNLLSAEDFSYALGNHPSAIRGAVYWGPEWYRFYRGALDLKAFEFFARDDAYFMVCASLTKPSLTLIGDMLCYISEPSLKELTTLDLDKTEAMVVGIRAAFGARTRDVLSHPKFASEVLHKIVESVRDLNYKPEQLRQAVAFSCKAVAPDVLRWVDRKPVLAS